MTTPASQPMTAEQALALVRARWRETNHPVPLPGFPPPEDTIGNSYHQDEFPIGWVFRPGIAGLDRDPGLASTYPYYVVHRNGSVAKSAYSLGRARAVSLLDELDEGS